MRHRAQAIASRTTTVHGYVSEASKHELHYEEAMYRLNLPVEIKNLLFPVTVFLALLR